MNNNYFHVDLTFYGNKIKEHNCKNSRVKRYHRYV